MAGSRAEMSIRFLAIEEDHGDESSAAWIRGLMRLLKYLPGVGSFEIIAGEWQTGKAYQEFKTRHQSEPGLNIAWYPALYCATA